MFYSYQSGAKKRKKAPKKSNVWAIMPNTHPFVNGQNPARSELKGAWKLMLVPGSDCSLNDSVFKIIKSLVCIILWIFIVANLEILKATRDFFCENALR